MATYYSNHFSSVASATAKEIGHSVGPAGGPGVADQAVVGHGRCRTDISTFTFPVGFVTTSWVVMTTMRATDRIYEIRMSAATQTATTFNVDLGLYTWNSTNTGAVKDVDLFSGSTIYDLDSVSGAALAYTSFFARTGGVPDVDRGKPLWEMVGDSEGDVAAYDIAITVDTTGTVQAEPLTLYVDYISGD